jgi:hypothetical protein
VIEDTNKPKYDRITESYLAIDNPPTGETLKLIEALSKRVITIPPDTKADVKPPWDYPHSIEAFFE